MTKPRRVIFAVAALALAIAAFAVGVSYRHDISVQRARVAAAGRVVATRCGPLEYAEAGRGPAVLVVHGAGGGYDQGIEIGAPIARAGFRVIAPSRFGYLGTSLPPDGSAAAQADAHACLLDALGIDRAAIMGVSAGAPSAMQFVLRHPRRASALVLLVPAAFVPRAAGAAPIRTPPGVQLLFETALASDFLYWAATRLARPTLIRAMLATPVEVVESAGAEERARVSRLLEEIQPVGRRRLGLINDGAVVSTLPRYELERIEAPTLAVSAADDLFGTFDTARYTAEHIRGARFIAFPSGGHLLAGRSHEADAAIVRFLAEHAK
jgi:2-hydroxy-6-oxonona-2,4-dienedioate hydrolase